MVSSPPPGNSPGERGGCKNPRCHCTALTAPAGREEPQWMSSPMRLQRTSVIHDRGLEMSFSNE
jgi:predicted CxxxxCH...CXXCH cytochrome family protein